MFTLPIGAWLNDRPLRRRNLAAALTVTAGLAVFLIVANLSGGRGDATVMAWNVSGSICAAVCVPLAVAGFRAEPARKAALLGSAAGILYGL